MSNAGEEEDGYELKHTKEMQMLPVSQTKMEANDDLDEELLNAAVSHVGWNRTPEKLAEPDIKRAELVGVTGE